MTPKNIVITDMPGPAWWEFWMQWSGLMIQAGAAAAAVGAVLYAVRVYQRDSRWKHEQQERELAFVAKIVKQEMDLANQALNVLFGRLKDRIWGIRDASEMDDVLSTALAYLHFDATWKIVDKLSWFPPSVSSRIAEMMGAAPLIERHVSLLLTQDIGEPLLSAELERAVEQINRFSDKASYVKTWISTKEVKWSTQSEDE